MSNLGIATNKKLLELFNMMKDGSLILAPRFQRKLVWNDNHKESFIETILKGLPFPEIYLADGDIDLESQRSTTLVVDGQQRLSTIYQYVTAAEDFTVKRIKKFSDLTKGEKTDFYDYQIVVRSLGRIDDDTIKEIFQRINSVNYALNAVEIQNALYEGEFISTAKEIVEEKKSVKELFQVFSEREFSRMKDIEFILLVMSTIEEKGYFGGSSAVDDYVKNYNSDYPNKKAVKDSISQVFKLISDCKLELDSIWYRKSSFFTLVVELLKYQQVTKALPKVELLSKSLKKFEGKVYASKSNDIKKDRFAEYYYYTFQGTSGKTGRTTRGYLLMEHLMSMH